MEKVGWEIAEGILQTNNKEKKSIYVFHNQKI